MFRIIDGRSSGKTSRLMELQTHVDTLAEVLAMLQSDNETLLDVNIFVTAYDYELSEQMLHPERTKTKSSSIASMMLETESTHILSVRA